MIRLYLFFIFLFCFQTLDAQTVGTQGEVRWRYFPDYPLMTWSIEDFERTETFPNGPTYIRTINSLATPINYNDVYGSLVKGFIHSTTGGQVVFNVNGDDEVEFYLSTDATATNLVLIDADTSMAEIANLDTLMLQANQHYYFELKHFELGGGDFATVEWKADFLLNGISSTNWLTVGGDNIFDTSDTPCNQVGTPCDDGNANTENDQEDGNCNCTGTPITTNTCVGERGVLQGYVYDGIAGGAVTALDDAITNGVQPDKIDLVSPYFRWHYRGSDNGDPEEYGTLIQAYLKVPVTGYYDFNITGSDGNVFFISSDDDPTNKTATTIGTRWWTGVYGHDVGLEYDWNPGQTAEGLLLNADQYYYVEVRHKGSGGWELMNLFWKTPYQTRDEWVHLPTFHFFDYTCETNCVKSGIACNDGDPYTANDQWDGNCNCAGTPCVAPDCDDPTTSYNTPDECETTNEISNRADDAWLSCTPQANAPNSTRDGQHWIQYDFGGLYRLDASQIWNYNAQNATNQGFQEVVIDYSSDGINWEELGTYNWNLAPGTTNYEGFAGPNFSGITARYVLISSNDDPNSCRGLSKVAFNAVSCPDIRFTSPQLDQTLMDPVDIPITVEVTGGEAAVSSVAIFLDGNWIASDNTAPYSWSNLSQLQNLLTGDYKLSAVVTDANGTECELATVIHVTSVLDGDCQTTAMNLTSNADPVYLTTSTITSSTIVTNGESILYQAGESITLTDGFHAQAGSDFTARIAECTPPSLTDPANSRIANLSTPKIGEHKVKLFPNPVVDNFTLTIDAYKAGTLDLRIYDVLGKELSNFTHKKLIAKGEETIDLSAANLTAGLYYCKIKIGEETFTKSFVRVDNN